MKGVIVARDGINAGLAEERDFIIIDPKVKIIGNLGWTWRTQSISSYPYVAHSFRGVQFAGFQFGYAPESVSDPGHWQFKRTNWVLGCPIWTLAILPLSCLLRSAFQMKHAGRKASAFPVVFPDHHA